MHYLFGYGSLLSPGSTARTLQRPLSLADLSPARLSGFKRTWTAAAEVTVTEESVARDYTARFLDLSAAPGSICNGVLLEVHDSEWDRLDLRERNYRRVEVQVELDGKTVPAFTYIVPDHEKRHDGVVLLGYLEIVRRALLDYSEEFNREFWSGTDEPGELLVSGSYVFQDREQNRATGRE